MRRGVVSLFLVVGLAGCGGGDAGFYDKSAKDVALRAARNDPFGGQSEVVTVGSATERKECPQAPSALAGPCLNVTVTAALRASNASGETGQTVQTTFDAFIWLRKRNDGHWEVTHKTYRPKGVAVDGLPYAPGS